MFVMKVNCWVSSSVAVEGWLRQVSGTPVVVVVVVVVAAGPQLRPRGWLSSCCLYFYPVFHFVQMFDLIGHRNSSWSSDNLKDNCFPLIPLSFADVSSPNEPQTSNTVVVRRGWVSTHQLWSSISYYVYTYLSIQRGHYTLTAWFKGHLSVRSINL